MTIDEAKKMIEAKLKCMERDVSGKDDDCNNHRCNECPLNYEQGNMGEQKEWLRMAINALEQTRWIPITYRPMTDEEKKDYAERTGFDEEDLDTILNCKLPKDGETVLITDRLGNVEVDIFINDCEGCYFECNCDMEDVKAWKPLPKPYLPDTNIGNMSENLTGSESEG